MLDGWGVTWNSGAISFYKGILIQKMGLYYLYIYIYSLGCQSFSRSTLSRKNEACYTNPHGLGRLDVSQWFCDSRGWVWSCTTKTTLLGSASLLFLMEVMTWDMGQGGNGTWKCIKTISDWRSYHFKLCSFWSKTFILLMAEILHQLRLVVFPIIFRLSYIPGG